MSTPKQSFLSTHSPSSSISSPTSPDSPILPAPTFDTTPFPTLSSRFSADTLKSPSDRLHRWFTDKPFSPPPLPSLPSFGGHKASVSEGRLNFGSGASSPTSSSAGATTFGIARQGWRLQEGGVEGEERGKRWGGVAREMKEVLGTVRAHARRRSSSSSGKSGRSVSRERRNSVDEGQTGTVRGRSISNPSPVKQTFLAEPEEEDDIRTAANTSANARPTLAPPSRAPPPPPSSSSSNSSRSPTPTRAAAPLKAHELPPRSDSRQQVSTRADCPPGRRPLLTRAKAPRPILPPKVSAAVVPLNLPQLASPAPGPFKALVTRSSWVDELDGKSDEEVFVALNAGGTTFLTRVETLARAGKLGEFVGDVVASARAERVKLCREMKKEGSMLRVSSDCDDDGESLKTGSHFAVSPFPSPFAYSAYDRNPLDLTPLLSSVPFEEEIIVPLSPGSPVDPFAKKLFAPFTPDSPTTPTRHLRSGSQGTGELVPSPPLDKRVHSVYPDYISHSFTPRALVRETEGEENPFERALGPFFDVLPGQSLAMSSAARSPVRESVGVPVDVSEVGTDVSFNPLPTVQSSLVLPSPKRALPPVPTLQLPGAEQRRPSHSSTGSRPPSLCNSLSSSEDGPSTTCAPSASKGEGIPTLEVFLDRDSAPYEGVLSFLRTGSLPPTHALPHLTSSHPTKSQPAIPSSTLDLMLTRPALLAERFDILRSLGREARWLGMGELEDAVKREMKRVGEVVSWVGVERKRELREEERKKRVEVGRERVAKGWI